MSDKAYGGMSVPSVFIKTTGFIVRQSSRQATHDLQRSSEGLLLVGSVSTLESNPVHREGILEGPPVYRPTSGLGEQRRYVCSLFFRRLELLILSVITK